MEKFPIKDNPIFCDTMRKLKTTDLAHADTFNPGYQTLLDNDNYLKNEADRLKNIRMVTLEANGWTANPPYTQTVLVKGITEADNPLLVKILNMVSKEEMEAYNDAFWAINQGCAETGKDSITFWTYERPETDIVIELKGI